MRSRLRAGQFRPLPKEGFLHLREGGSAGGRNARYFPIAYRYPEALGKSPDAWLRVGGDACSHSRGCA
jgi:hypothetical protein